MKDESTAHVRILAFERWRVEVKARSSTGKIHSNVGIVASRFDRVREALTEVVQFLKNIQEDNTILGVVVDPGLRNAVAGSVVTILSLAVQGMYSLYVLDESPSESLL